MQVTELQVQRSLQALADDGTDVDRAPAGTAAAPGDLPDGLVARLVRTPPIRIERVEEARRHLELHAAPSAEALAQRMVGRLVCDRLR